MNYEYNKANSCFDIIKINIIYALLLTLDTIITHDYYYF